MVSWQAFPSLPPFSRSPRVSLTPKIPFPFPFKRLPGRLGRRLHLSMNKNHWVQSFFNLQQTQAAKLRKPLTEVSKIDSKKRHAVFNNFKETDLRLFITKNNNNNNSKKYEKVWLRQINVFSWDKLSSRQ